MRFSAPFFIFLVFNKSEFFSSPSSSFQVAPSSSPLTSLILFLSSACAFFPLFFSLHYLVFIPSKGRLLSRARAYYVLGPKGRTSANPLFPRQVLSRANRIFALSVYIMRERDRWIDRGGMSRERENYWVACPWENRISRLPPTRANSRGEERDEKREREKSPRPQARSLA